MSAILAYSIWNIKGKIITAFFRRHFQQLPILRLGKMFFEIAM